MASYNTKKINGIARNLGNNPWIYLLFRRKMMPDATGNKKNMANKIPVDWENGLLFGGITQKNTNPKPIIEFSTAEIGGSQSLITRLEIPRISIEISINPIASPQTHITSTSIFWSKKVAPRNPSASAERNKIALRMFFFGSKRETANKERHKTKNIHPQIGIQFEGMDV